MKKTLLIAALASVVGVMQFSTPVAAAENGEMHQEQEQKLKVECTTGSYGQSTTCTAEGKQRQEQRQKVLGQQIAYRAQGGGLYHKPVDTALDAKTSAAIMAIALIGAGAFVATRKIA